MKGTSSFKYNEITNNDLSRLVQDAKNNHNDALEKLCKFVYYKIYGYTYYRVKQKEDAEDLTSEVLMKMARSLKTQKGNFLAWVYRIASNQIIDFYRHRARRPEISIESLKRDIPGSEVQRDILKEDKMKEAISRLTPEQSNVITLKFIQEYSNEEIAKIMNKTVGAIKVLQFRALKALREYLRKEGYATKY